MSSIIASWKKFSFPLFSPFRFKLPPCLWIFDGSIFNAITWKNRWFRLRTSTVSKKRERMHQTTAISAFILQDDLSGRSMYDPFNVIRSLPTGHCPSLNRIRGRPIWLHSLNALRLPISVFSLFARVLVRATPRYRASRIWSMLLVSGKGRL